MTETSKTAPNDPKLNKPSKKASLSLIKILWVMTVLAMGAGGWMIYGHMQKIAQKLEAREDFQGSIKVALADLKDRIGFLEERASQAPVDTATSPEILERLERLETALSRPVIDEESIKALIDEKFSSARVQRTSSPSALAQAFMNLKTGVLSGENLERSFTQFYKASESFPDVQGTARELEDVLNLKSSKPFRYGSSSSPQTSPQTLYDSLRDEAANLIRVRKKSEEKNITELLNSLETQVMEALARDT